MALWLCIIAIIVSIFVGWKFKLNTGIIAMAFAFVIGIFVMGMKASAIIAYWPTTIVFYLLSIALFFNYATENGTMSVLGQKLLHAMGGNAKLVPFAIALVSAIVGGLGAALAEVNPEGFEQALKLLLTDYTNIAYKKDGSAEINALTQDDANEIFCQALDEMIELAIQVVKANFLGFFN